MSDLYLVLRHRLEEVSTEWVPIPSPILKKARKAKGLSYESLARQIPTSSKTWERYEKAGRVPRSLLPRIADILDLEITEPARQRITASTVSPDQLVALAERVEEVLAEVRQLRALVEPLAATPPTEQSGTPPDRLAR
jgi:transcriptional regulator with XRE-family HTH domain